MVKNPKDADACGGGGDGGGEEEGSGGMVELGKEGEERGKGYTGSTALGSFDNYKNLPPRSGQDKGGKQKYTDSDTRNAVVLPRLDTAHVHTTRIR
ncbi:hypothetical protein E2C01_066383 [Portunus trituberculatus]|uniref:Uncharacterized protein n=1 Tax=Portunus trituberculatus TaxID=210409 RepID=A0A5B7HI23_PORTR|nr:hypothetical protein [Portunus trituberculatus]